jgi:hypothetical protein
MISLRQISMLVFGRPSTRSRSRARRRAPERRSGEAGYTLLFAVFLAASMLIMLSVLTLRVTTQGQREAEEEMIWRGHQYERGIRRYLQKFGRYPTKIDDLVKATSGVRYMREAYKDPMNKEDGSWRFIYVTPAGQLIGSVRYTSLVQMALMDKMASMGGNMNATIPGTSPLNGNAASPFGNSSGFGSPGGFGSSNNSFGSSSSGFGSQGSSGFGQQGNQGTNQNNFQQNQNQSGNQNNSGGDNSGNGNPGSNSTGSSFGNQNSPGGQNGLGGGGSSAFGISGNGNGQQSGSAFGFSSDQNGGSSPLGQMSVLGGSITGVGSKIEKPSLMVYKRAKKYKEWEFIYNPIEQQQQAAAGMGGGGGIGIGQPANGQGGIGGSGFGSPGGGTGGLGGGGGLSGGPGGSNPFSPQPTPPQQPQQNP